MTLIQNILNLIYEASRNKRIGLDEMNENERIREYNGKNEWNK